MHSTLKGCNNIAWGESEVQGWAIIMGSSLVKIDIHLIFHVKTTSPKIEFDDLERVWLYIGGIIRNKVGIAIQIGGMPDHIHILTTLPKNMNISEFVRIIKIDSSKWIKEIDDKYVGFMWQSGYGAFSVSPSIVPKIIEYILNQREHHRVKTFKEEYKSVLDAYGIDYDEQYIFDD